VLEVTQTHIHIHTHTFTPWRVPRGGGLEGRHAHGELEAHGGSGEEYGSCVRENDGCRDSRTMVCKEGVGGGPREAIPGGIMGGRRACVLTKCSQRAVEGGGERARGLGNQEGHRVTAALGVGVVVVACLAEPAGACDAAPRAISLCVSAEEPSVLPLTS
jgi:hypothetical protein